MEIYDTIADYPNLTNLDFNIDIYKKKEFNELIQAPRDIFFPHQKIIARFMSHWTLYDGLLLLHDTGTGKSGSVTAVYEGLRRHNRICVLYLTNNETLIDNFKNELIRRSPFLKKSVENEVKDLDTTNEIFKRVRNRVLTKEGFDFSTYATFATRLKTEDSSLAKYWANNLIVMDESHHLVVQNITKADGVYNVLHKWIHSIPKKRVLLLTATPMRNSVHEITPLLNFILPSDQQFEIGTEFEEKYFDSNILKKDKGIPTLSWKTGMKDTFENKIRGLISVVKQNTDVKVEYQGKVIPPMTNFKLYSHIMDKIQTKTYLLAWNKDTNDNDVADKASTTAFETSFYSNSEQATLATFPGDLYGPAGNSKYLEEGSKLNSLFLRQTGLRKGIKFMEQNLAIIKKYSATYESVLRHILENPTEHVFVYCDKVKGSGILFCMALLTNLFDYGVLKGKNTNWSQKNKRPRCLLLNEIQEDVKEQEFQGMIDTFNDENNIFAEYVQVVFGTDKTKEGISLKRIRQIHITTPDWNFGKIFQAIGRGNRLLSHQDLDEEDKNLSIFFHCCIPDLPNPTKALDQSIDFYRYYRSELRDFNIRLVEYSIFISAFDCQLNKTLNDRSPYEDGTSDCFYQKCDYTCNGFEGIDTQTLVYDWSSYDNYYIMEKIKYCTDKIFELFSQYPLWKFEDICKELLPLELTPREIFESLQTIIDTPLTIMYRGFQKMYMMNEKDNFFLVDDITFFSKEKQENVEFLTYYGIQPSFKVGMSYENLVSSLRQTNWIILKIMKTVLRLLEKPGDYSKHIQKILNVIPLATQEDLILSILAQFKTNPNKFFTFLTDVFYKGILEFHPNGSISHSLFPQKTREFDPVTKTWHDLVVVGNAPITTTVPTSSSTTVQEKNSHHTLEFIKKYITDNPYKIYAYFKGKNKEEFKIRDVRKPEKIAPEDKKHETSGQECTSYKVRDLLFFLFILGIRFPVMDPKNKKWEKTNQMTKEEIIKELTSKTKVKNWEGFLEDLKDFKYSYSQLDALKFYHYYVAVKKVNLCNLIKDELTKLQLITEPPV